MLFDDEMLAQFKGRLSVEELAAARHWRSGRSTAQALGYLAEAIRSPRHFIPVMDHHGTVEANKHLVGMIMDIAAKLDLKHIKSDKNRLQQVGIYFDWKHPLEEKKAP